MHVLAPLRMVALPNRRISWRIGHVLDHFGFWHVLDHFAVVGSLMKLVPVFVLCLTCQLTTKLVI
jgi:hypothetical protein